MKRVFLFLTALLFAVTGITKAGVDVEVGMASSTNNYIPDYTYYDYSLTQQIYTAAEIGLGGTINSISFDVASGSATRSLDVYLKHVTRSTFASTTDWEPMAAADLVYSGNVTWAAGWTTITLATPFEYNGSDNLLVCVYDRSGTYVSSQSFRVYTSSNAALRAYRDDTPYDVAAPGVTGSRLAVKNHIKLNMELGPSAITATPNSIDLGYRPIGAWMKPATVTLNNMGNNATVSMIETNNSFFTVDTEVPFAVNFGEPATFEVGTGTANAGAQNGQVMVAYADSRNFTTVDVTATAYEPVDGDVWEKAINVTDMPYSANAPEQLYKNYDLPSTSASANDAVYKVTFDQDVLFSAGTSGANGNAVMYTEDFNEVGGPDADNYYEYNGPEVGPGPISMWFSYAYTGTNTFYGTSAGGGYYYGYKIPAMYIEALDLAGTTITTIETASREAYDYECYVLKGGATPFDGQLVSFGMASPEASSFFDIDLDEPVLVGEGEDIWVIFYSESPYASYCGRTPVDAENGKIWTYNPNATTPAWTSNTSYTPCIYTHFIELPTGREVTVNFAQMTVKEGNGTVSEVAAIDGTANGISKGQRYNEFKAQNRGNRDTQVILEDGFEGGIGEWTMSNCETNTGAYNVGSSSAFEGTYAFRFYYTYNTPQYLITPELTANNGGTLSFYCRANSSTYPETYKIGYSTTTNDVSAFTFGDEVTVTSLLYEEHTATFPAGTKYLAIALTSYDKYYFFVDNVTVTADVTTGGGEATYQIADMFVPAGTYYVVTASTGANFHVDMMTANVPAPEQAIIVYPYDGEQNVEDLYLAEWVLGDYTTEMQVLLGTQYPPTDIMIDWTSELVESAFLMNLENNKTYFMQVNARNAAGTTYGEIVGFTTPFDPVEGFEVVETELYPGDAAEFSWEANTRSLLGYNLYKDGELVNTDGPITATEYAVEDLAYNMSGYAFQVAALYSAGESALSAPLMVQMTGTATISGTVYDQDSVTVIPNAAIEFRGIDEYGHEQVIAATADETGAYTCDVLVGNFTPYVVSEGFAADFPAAPAVTVVYDEAQTVNLYTHEMYYPLGMIRATEQTDENNVLVEWDWTPAEVVVDFETGDFSQADFTLPATYPWEITTVNPYEGTYAMKSTCEGVASGVSSIEATVEVPFDAMMGFWVKVSSESNYDKFFFYIDGVQQGAAISGNVAYTRKEFAVTAGTHTYKWEYAKDGSVNSNDDCVYVDNITMYMPAPPAPSGMTYNFDDETLQGWTSLDADNDGYGWVSSSNPGQYHNAGVTLTGSGHNESTGFVLSGSYSNATGIALTPDNYLVAPSKIAAQNGAVIAFWAQAQDANYAAEHFGVAVSTASNTSASDFTTVAEWTMTAKGVQGPAADETIDIRGTRATGEWYQYTADLSAYAGQEIWVAIRHFGCTDMFILNVDDIILGDGSDAAIARGDNRSFQGFNLYRRNNIDEASVATPELIASPAADVFDYIDNDWANLPYGEYQWGIQALYEGNAPTRNRDEVLFTEDFEAGNLNNWTVIDNGSPAGQAWAYQDVSSLAWGEGENAHSGVGVAVSWSWNSSAINQNSYLITPLVEGATSVNYFVNTNSSYPDHYQLMASSTGTNVADFTVVFEETPAKGVANGMKRSLTKGGNTRFDAWVERNVDLPEGTKYVAFHHVDYDANYLFLDDVTVYGGGAPVPPTPVVTGDGKSEILWSNVIDKDMISAVTVNVALNNAQDPTGATVNFDGNNTYEATVDATGTVEFNNFRKGEYAVTIALDDYVTINDTVLIDEDEMTLNYVLEEIIIPVEGLYVSSTGWAMWEGEIPGGPVTPTPTPGEGQWYYYGDDVNATGIGAGAAFYWAVMFPAGSYTGNMVTKVANFGSHNDTYATNGAFTGSVTIYNDGTSAPANAVGTMDISMPDVNTLVEFEFPTPVTIDPSKNLWIVFYNASSTDYVASACADAGDLNGRWVSLDGTTWQDLATAGVSGYNWMIRAYVASGSKDNVVEILDPMKPIANPGTLAMAPQQNRVALSYKVVLDGNYEGETENPYWQHNVEGFEEGSEHVTKVAAVYATGLSDWMEYTWTYVPCDNFNGLTGDLEAEVANDAVTLNWTMPSGPTPPTPPAGNTTFTENFEGGLNGWNVINVSSDGGSWIHSDNNLGGYDYTTLAHGGTGFAMCYSYVDYVGAYNTDSYMYTPQMYSIVNGSTLNFWADNANDSYPENFSVCVATAANPTASDFTQVWSGGAKGTGSNGATIRRAENRYENWRSHSIDLSAYAGQNVWIAFHDVNYDMYEIWIDDVELTAPSKGGRVVLYEPHYVTDPGAMSNGADASWTKNGQTTLGPNNNHASGYMLADDFTLAGNTTITEIEVYGYQTGSTTTSTFTGLYATIYDGAPNAGGNIVWGNMDDNIMTATSFTNCYRGSDNDVTGTTRPLMAITASGLNIELSAGTYYLVWNLTGSSSSGPWAGIEALPGVGNTGNGLQYNGTEWVDLLSGGTNEPYGGAFKLVGDSDAPVPASVIGAFVFRDGELLTPTPITTNTFVDADLADGEYEYCVRVVYSDYSMSCPECVVINYTGVKEQDVVDNIYPNPTSGIVTIEAMGMNHITVVSTLGQVVYDADVNADQIQLNLGQYKAGLYLVRVNTESGVSVKRVTVVK